ncbi:MAG: universal stress protein [Anaerolineae bacterium]|nr:universal stress protein [Anaerolineae bacterium]
MFDKILVAVDGSEYSNHAVNTAANLAKIHNSSVLLLHVIRDWALPKEIEAMILAGEITASRLEVLRDSGQIILDKAKEKFEAGGILDIKSEILEGSPATKIVDYAEENEVDLIILGHRGLGSAREMLGSISNKVSNLTKISCLIVK